MLKHEGTVVAEVERLLMLAKAFSYRDHRPEAVQTEEGWRLMVTFGGRRFRLSVEDVTDDQP